MAHLLRRLRRRVARRRGERGSAAVFVVGFSIVLFVAAGLVADGGVAINARMRVADDAEQAARAGADAIDLATLRSSGQLAIDPAAAQGRAAGYLQDLGYGGGQYAVSVSGGTVEVELRDRADTLLLGIVGIDDFPVSADATSTPCTDTSGACG